MLLFTCKGDISASLRVISCPVTVPYLETLRGFDKFQDCVEVLFHDCPPASSSVAVGGFPLALVSERSCEDLAGCLNANLKRNTVNA